MILDGFEHLHPLDVVRYLSSTGINDIVFFDSGTYAKGRALWSIVCAYPKDVLRIADNGEAISTVHGRVDILQWLRDGHRRHARDYSDSVDTQPAENASQLPFVGGIAGYLSFEAAWMLDTVATLPRSSELPLLWLGDFPCALVYDHLNSRWHIVGDSEDCGYDLLIRDLHQSRHFVLTGECSDWTFNSENPSLSVSEAEYLSGVGKCISAIEKGEVFEVNYTERFIAKWSGSLIELYRRMRKHSTGQFGGLIQSHDVAIASISPEQFLSVTNGLVRTRPIKGTRRRDANLKIDQALADELIRSEKDRAENIMIVDLMRNDLTRVCELGSVRAVEICALESFGGVHHLVSTVTGKLVEGIDAMDAFLSCFPAGSITGAPKLRAIELIASYEHTPRGPYCGSMVYWSACGRLDSNVLIRTAVLKGDYVEYGAGGAVVADSEPLQEYEEAWVKAQPFIKAFANEL